MPFGYRQDEIDAGPIGHNGCRDHVVPFRRPTFRRQTDCQASIAIHIKQTKLETIWPIEGVIPGCFASTLKHRSYPKSTARLCDCGRLRDASLRASFGGSPQSQFSFS
jgi:hypothetical protein